MRTRQSPENVKIINHWPGGTSQPDALKPFCAALGSAWGMDEVGLGALAASTGAILLFLRHLGGQIMHKLGQLDADLALAIQKVGLEASSVDFEPPNPIQGIIAQLLAERMAPQTVVVHEKDPKGRFTRSKTVN